MNGRQATGPVRALSLLMLFDVVLRTRGLERALRLARRLGDRPVLDHWDEEQTEQVARAVALAAAFYPRRALCLEQSLALFVALRRSGAPATLRIGVRPMPFLAHAWVEVRGRAVNEAPDFIAQLAPFPGLGG